MNFNHKFNFTWENSGSEPSNNIKANGFQVGYKPPAGFFNWFWAKVINATTELQTVVSNIDSAVSNKVDKVTGKGLSTNDYTTAEKTKLTGIEAQANKYTHPTYSSKSSNLYKVTVDSSGHVSNASAVEKADLIRLTGSSTTVASGTNAYALGTYTTAFGDNSFASGKSSSSATSAISDITSSTSKEIIISNWTSSNKNYSLAFGNVSHVEGSCCLALGNSSHAEGITTVASGNYSHAEGMSSSASGQASRAEGNNTVALGSYSHAGGYYCHANGDNSFAFGSSSIANGVSSTVIGLGINAKAYQTVFGRYNAYSASDSDEITSASDANAAHRLFTVGCGTSNNNRSNALSIYADGKCKGASAFAASGADFAEYFEWADGNENNEDRRGKLVTLDGEKIRLANSTDEIIGAISCIGSFVGNAACEEWQDKYMKDVFGERLTEEIEVPEYVDESTGKTISAHTETRFIINPEYDPNETYTDRINRKEWAAVGLVGQVVVVDDGTCTVGGYCSSSTNGIGTAAESGYKVIKRIDDTHIKVLVK